VQPSHDDLDQRIADLECMVGRMAMELEMVKKVPFYGTTTGFTPLRACISFKDFVHCED